jgi:hypothetical protein
VRVGEGGREEGDEVAAVDSDGVTGRSREGVVEAVEGIRVQLQLHIRRLAALELGEVDVVR